MWLQENPLAAMALVAVLAALGFLALKAVVDGLATVDLITAPLVGVGSAIGYRIGVRRSRRRK